MDECIFCKIIKGEIPSKDIYEDEIVKVILNIKPEENGDLLILLKRHISDFTELNDEEAKHINQIVKKLKEKLYDKLNPTGIQLITNSGTCQEIKHFHIHVTPGYEPKQPLVDLDIIYDRIIH